MLDLVKVSYSDEIPDFNFFESMMSGHKYQDMITILTTKSVHWSYEREYRLMYWDGINVSVGIGHSAVVEVILGCRTSCEGKQRILALLEDRRTGAHFVINISLSWRTRAASGVNCGATGLI